MTSYKDLFKGKKITIMGLGLLGRGIGYTKFLAEQGAILTVTDLKTAEQLATSVKTLSKYKNIKFVLGKHELADFKNADMIIKAAGVPLDSIYIKEAKKNKIPVEMDASLFAQIVPEAVIVGITGTRGKSMTTTLIYEILKANTKFLKSPSIALGAKTRNVFLGGNIRGKATLPLAKYVKDGDIVVLELDSWQLQGFGEAHFSPDISVFTSFMPDHMNYYGSATLTTSKAMERYFADKANIFKYQQEGDVLVIRPGMKKLIPKDIKSDLIVADLKQVASWKWAVPGAHQRENLAAAVEVAKIFEIPMTKIKKTVSEFEGVEGRLQFVKEVRGIKIYNDNNATTPEATVAGLEALSTVEVRHRQSRSELDKRIVIIAGGADKGLDLKPLVTTMNKHCKGVVLLEGTGTTRLINNYKLKIKNEAVKNLKDAVKNSLDLASRGDIIVFSPAFASFGMFTNEYDRNDQFMKIIKKLK